MDLERSASINRSLGSRVAQCSLNGLADFLYRFDFTKLSVLKSEIKERPREASNQMKNIH